MKKVLIVQRGVTHYRKLLFEFIEAQGEYSIDVVSIGDKEEHKGNVYTFSSQELFKYKNYKLRRSKGMIDFVKRNCNSYNFIILEGATNLINNIPICKYLISHNKSYLIWDAGRRKNSKMSFLRRIAQGRLEYVWKNASGIIAYSTLAKKYFSDIGIPDSKIFVCQNTLYVGAFDRQIQETCDLDISKIKKSYAPNGEKIVLYVGAVEARKRISDLVEAFKIIHGKKPNTSLIIIGGGEQLEELRENVKEIKNCYVTGAIIEGVIPYFMAADVFVLPSEGGLSLNQAMITGKPVIASSADGTELDLIDDGKNGYLFEETNIKQMAERILDVISDDAICSAMGRHSREIIDQKVNENQFYINFKHCLEFVEQSRK